MDLNVVQVYIDEVVIGSKNFEEHTNNLTFSYDTVKDSDLKIMLRKSLFDITSIEMLS